MFIRESQTTNGKTKKKYTYLRLVENYRSGSKVKQKMILNLGKLDIDKSQYDVLAKRIESILTKQQLLPKAEPYIEKIAKEAADKIVKKQRNIPKASSIDEFETVDLNFGSFELSDCRTIGPEYVLHSIWEELQLGSFFDKKNISKSSQSIMEALIFGRLINAGSEQWTYEWVNNRSALFELTGAPIFNSLSTYYRCSDTLFDLKDKIEDHLRNKETTLFDLKEKYYLFDLTNTHFEGKYLNSKKAKYGRSKQKRKDCKLVTLGMVVDDRGFCKYSNLYPGNQYEGHTLLDIINALDDKAGKKENNLNKTIVIDAGISEEDNINLLKDKKFKYIAVNRGNPPFEKDFEDMTTIRNDENNHIEVKKFEADDEVYLLVKSDNKQKKEQAIRDRIDSLFIEKIDILRSGLDKPKRIKKYTKVIDSIGRLKAKYSKASKLYDIEVVPENSTKKKIKNLNAIDIIVNAKEERCDEELKNEGSYVLRTNRKDLSEKEIWDIYVKLNNIEKAFLSMKSHLGIRPNHHHIEDRVDAHMFISVLAYHFLNIVEQRLRESGDNRKWSTICEILSNHARSTISFKTREDNKEKNNFIRLNTTPTNEQLTIYKSLNLSGNPLPQYVSKYS